MGFVDVLKKLLILAVLVTVIGGLAGYGLGLILPAVQGINLVGGLIAGIIAIVLYLYISTVSDIEKTDIGYLVPLLAAAGIIGTFIISVIPQATGYVLTLDANLTWMSVLWTMIYAGIALVIADKAGL